MELANFNASKKKKKKNHLSNKHHNNNGLALTLYIAHIKRDKHLLSQSGRLGLLKVLSLSVCPAITAYISLTLGQILMKLGRNMELRSD